MVQILQQQLLRAQQHQKLQANKNRTERTFEVGDSVYLKLQPYVQTSVATRANHKLSFRYFGPYKIIAKVGPMAYKLLLPNKTTVHPVFHVSQLKKAISPDIQVTPDLPHSIATDALRFPVKVLHRRLKSQGDQLVSEVLIQWSSWPPSMATWELEVELKQLFPAAPAWGQAGTKGGGDVRNPNPEDLASSEPEDDPGGDQAGIDQEAVSSPPGPAEKTKPKTRTVSSSPGPVEVEKPV
jgi:hypothetical protein